MSDENLNHPAVKAYRDVMKKTPNWGYRKDIAATVENQELWKQVLETWGYWKADKWIKFNPLNVKGLLSSYERKLREIQQRNGAHSSVSATGAKHLSARECNPVSEVQHQASVYDQRNSRMDDGWFSALQEMRKQD